MEFDEKRARGLADAACRHEHHVPGLKCEGCDAIVAALRKYHAAHQEPPGELHAYKPRVDQAVRERRDDANDRAPAQRQRDEDFSWGHREGSANIAGKVCDALGIGREHMDRVVEAAAQTRDDLAECREQAATCVALRAEVARLTEQLRLNATAHGYDVRAGFEILEEWKRQGAEVAALRNLRDAAAEFERATEKASATFGDSSKSTAANQDAAQARWLLFCALAACPSPAKEDGQ